MSAKDMSGNAWQEAMEEIASYLSVGVEGCTPEEAVARIKEAATDLARVQMERAERAEDALKKARGQEPCAFWWIGPDGKDNGGPYRGKPSDVAIDNARNMGCEPALLYARPVPAPAVPKGNPAQWLDQPVRRSCFKKTTENWGDSFKLAGGTVMLLEVSIRVVGNTVKVAVWGDDDGGMEQYFTTQQDAETCFNHLMGLDVLTHDHLKSMGFAPA